MPKTIIHDTIEQSDAKRVTKADLLLMIQRQNRVILALSKRVHRLEHEGRGE